MFSAATFTLTVESSPRVGTFWGPGTKFNHSFFCPNVTEVAEFLKRIKEKFLWLKRAINRLILIPDRGPVAFVGVTKPKSRFQNLR